MTVANACLWPTRAPSVDRQAAAGLADSRASASAASSTVAACWSFGSVAAPYQYRNASAPLGGSRQAVEQRHVRLFAIRNREAVQSPSCLFRIVAVRHGDQHGGRVDVRHGRWSQRTRACRRPFGLGMVDPQVRRLPLHSMDYGRRAEALRRKSECWRRPKFDPLVRLVPTEI